jgi:hypothetical protein
MATRKTFWAAWIELASTYAWHGEKAGTAGAAVELRKVRPWLACGN